MDGFVVIRTIRVASEAFFINLLQISKKMLTGYCLFISCIFFTGDDIHRYVEKVQYAS